VGRANLHSLRDNSPRTGKRFLAGQDAKRGHFCVIGVGSCAAGRALRARILICEAGPPCQHAHGDPATPSSPRWMAGNLLCRWQRGRCGPGFRTRSSSSSPTIDKKPDRDTNPGVEAARRPPFAVDCPYAVPDSPRRCHDCSALQGLAWRTVAGARGGRGEISPPPPTTRHLPDAEQAVTPCGRHFALHGRRAATDRCRGSPCEAAQGRGLSTLDLCDFNNRRARRPAAAAMAAVDGGSRQDSRRPNPPSRVLARAVGRAPRWSMRCHAMTSAPNRSRLSKPWPARHALGKGRTAPDPTSENRINSCAFDQRGRPRTRLR